MSRTLDFLIAMLMVFLAFSVVVSGATESWNTWYGKRGQFLWKGLERIVGHTQEARHILTLLRSHPSIRGLAIDNTSKRAASYIPGTVFAAALTDIVLARNAGVRLDKYGLPRRSHFFLPICRSREYSRQPGGMLMATPHTSSWNWRAITTTAWTGSALV